MLYTSRTVNAAPGNAHPFNRNRNRAIYGTDDLPNKNLPQPKKWNDMNGAERAQYRAEKKAREDAIKAATKQKESNPATVNPEAGGQPDPAPSVLTPDVEEIDVK
jgi:hypothetical protein